MKKILTLITGVILITLSACNQENQSVAIPHCNNMGSGFYSRLITIENIDVYYGLCHLTEVERSRFNVGHEIPNLDDIVALDQESIPSMIIVYENGGYLLGTFVYHADLQPANELQIMPSLEAVSFTSTNDTFSLNDTDIRLTLHNESDRYIGFGYEHQLEFYTNNAWYTIPFAPNTAFASLLLSVETGGTYDFRTSLSMFESEVFNIIPGRYRIRLQVSEFDWDNNFDLDRQHDVVFELTIE